MKEIIDTNRWVFLAILLGLLLCFSCTKQEFMPAEVGEQVPYIDTVTRSMEEALASSPYTLFYEAWLRSNVQARLESLGAIDQPLTLLVPDNAAMQVGGWASAQIAGATTELLDTLVLSHLFYGEITAADLTVRDDNYPAVNLLEDDGLLYYEGIMDQSVHRFAPYRFRTYLNMQEERLWINGSAGGADAPIPATDGYIWPVNRLIEKPRQTVLDIIKNNERFRLYYQIMEYTDSLYMALLQQANGVVPAPGGTGYRNYAVQYGLDIGSFNIPFSPGLEYFLLSGNLTTRNVLVFRNGRYEQERVSGITGSPVIGALNTLLLPTNEAFAAAGFHNLEDLKAFNEQRGLPQQVWSTSLGAYQLQGEFATDTLLDYHHNWGKRYAPVLVSDLYRYPNFPDVCSNDLRQELLGGFRIFTYAVYYFGEPERLYEMPLYFYNEAGGTQIRVKGADAPVATVVVKDIMTLNGPVHGVDRLLVPAGFTLN